MRQLLQILIKKVAKISELVFVAAVIAPIVDQKYLSYPVIIVSFVCCILTLVLSVLYGPKAAEERFIEDTAQDQKMTAEGPQTSAA